jgi:hypothetical protein
MRLADGISHSVAVRVTFLGAAGTDTGSKYLLELGAQRLLVDCGLFQGLKRLRERNWQLLAVDVRSLDAVLLTHAHIARATRDVCVVAIMGIHNADVADAFDEMADLLDTKGDNPFRIRADRRAAQVARGLPRELAEGVAREFDTLPGQLAAFGISGRFDGELRRLFMSHPPLAERIAALRFGRYAEGYS